ncbi:MAG: HAD family phosphatase [Verrucomicrobiota bacterium]|jgi:putative hydrolase of the HAD superfamily|nr:HAD family phosphatase [Verrucomicrobiota bacterium]
MIKAVAFDIGKVLLDFDYSILVRKLTPQTRWNESELNIYLNQSPLLARYESGELGSSKFFRQIKEETGFRGSETDFAALFEDIFTPISGMIDMHRQIVRAGMPTFTFSNTNEMAARYIARTYDFWPIFTGHILSYEVGALKPEAKIYEALEECSGFTGGEIVYLDDLPENCAAGRERGWQVCCHKDVSCSCEFLRELGVLNPSLNPGSAS